ncbi:MAG: hypothetical protein RIF32_18310 [Leptospirales bacterium]|jgi:hypothetical protein
MADMHFQIGGRRRTKFFAMEHAPDSGPVHEVPRPPASAADAMMQELQGTIGPAAVSRLVASGEFDRIMGLAPPLPSGPATAGAAAPQREAVTKPETIQRKQGDAQSSQGITDPTEFCRAFFSELEPKTSTMIFDTLRTLQEQKAKTKDPKRVMAINRLVRQLQILRERLGNIRVACQTWEKRGYIDKAFARLFNRDSVLDNFNQDAERIVKDLQAVRGAMANLGM